MSQNQRLRMPKQRFPYLAVNLPDDSPTVFLKSVLMHGLLCSVVDRCRNTLGQIQHSTWVWWRRPLMPALGRQRQVDLWEFEASPVSRVSFRIFRATLINPVLLVLLRKPIKQNKKKIQHPLILKGPEEIQRNASKPN